MNQQGSCLLLVIIGVALIVIAIVLAIYNVGETRDRISENTPFTAILSDYFTKFVIAIILTAIGTVLIFLGVRR